MFDWHDWENNPSSYFGGPRGSTSCRCGSSIKFYIWVLIVLAPERFSHTKQSVTYTGSAHSAKAHFMFGWSHSGNYPSSFFSDPSSSILFRCGSSMRPIVISTHTHTLFSDIHLLLGFHKITVHVWDHSEIYPSSYFSGPRSSVLLWF